MLVGFCKEEKGQDNIWALNNFKKPLATFVFFVILFTCISITGPKKGICIVFFGLCKNL
jgi:hypothetical protein